MRLILGEQVPTLYRSKGCARCQEQGYVGRVAALEILVMNDEVRSAVARQAAPEEILDVATRSGSFVPLHRYLGFLIQHGITTPGEALSVLPRRSA